MNDVEDIAAILSDESPEESTKVEETHDEPEMIEESPEHDDELDDSTIDEDSDDADEDAENDGSSVNDDAEVTIDIDGEPTKVSIGELKNGYLRHSAFTRKSQEVAKERKELTSAMSDVVEQANAVKYQAHTKLAQFDNAIKQVGGWDKLRSSYSPEEVEQFTNLYVMAQKEADVANSLIKDYTSKAMNHNKAVVKEILDTMGQTISGFNTDTINGLDKYLTDNGFTADMALSMTHPQAWEMVYKAMMYDSAKSHSKQSKDKSVEGKVHRNVSPTPNHKPNKQAKLTKAINRQKEAGGRGRVADKAAQDAIALLLGNK